MNTRDPRHEDELDFVIRETLRTETEFEEPPAYMWNKIQSRLTEESSTVRKFRVFWLTPALQAALLLVLVFLQGVTPYSYSTQPTPVTSQMETTTVQTEASTTSPAVTRQHDDLDMQLLKERTKVASYDAQTVQPITSQPLPTANVFVRQHRPQQSVATQTESPRTPIILKQNLDLNR